MREEEVKALSHLLKWYVPLVTSLEAIMEIQRIYLEQDSHPLLDRWLWEWTRRSKDLTNRPEGLPLRPVLAGVPPAFDRPSDELISSAIPKFYLARVAWVHGVQGMFMFDEGVSREIDALQASMFTLNDAFFEVQRAFEGDNVGLLAGRLDHWRTLKAKHVRLIQDWLSKHQAPA